MAGYDTAYIKKIVDAVNIPVVALGGAGTVDHIRDIVINAGVSGAAAGSLFVLYGRHKAVLISYPSQDKIQHLLGTFINE